MTYVTQDYEELWRDIGLYRPLQVVCENFVGTRHMSKYGQLTLRIIGGIQAASLLSDIPCLLRIPGARYSHMKQADIEVKTKGPTRRHEVDAAAHLLSFERYGK